MSAVGIPQTHPSLVPDIVTVGEVNMAFLAGFLHTEFSGAPWNEAVRCPNCKPEGDFGPTHSWGCEAGLARCPDCGSELTAFWSPDRVEAYLSRPGCIGFVLYYQGDRDKMAFWLWGYPLSREEFYLDTVAIPKRYRRLGGFKAAFWAYVKYLRQSGYRRLKTRTHREAGHVRDMLTYLGFEEGEASREDADRTYWHLAIPASRVLDRLIKAEASKIPRRFKE